MRRGMVILAAALIVLAGVGIGVGAYNAGETRGVAQQIQTIETTAPDGTEVVRVVDPDFVNGYGYGGWGPPAAPGASSRSDSSSSRSS